MVRKQQKYSKLNDNIKYHLTSLNDYFTFLLHIFGMHIKRKQTQSHRCPMINSFANCEVSKHISVTVSQCVMWLCADVLTC